MTLAEKAVEVAITQIGVQEDPAHTNQGEAKKYQDRVGLPHGQGFPWCQSFLYWCYDEAATALGGTNPVVKTAGVLDCWNRTAEDRKIYRTDFGTIQILPGYQMIISEGAGLGHTGIIESVNDGKSINTIEGNTNSDGSRDGYEVCRHTRPLSNPAIIGIISYEVYKEI